MRNILLRGAIVYRTCGTHKTLLVPYFYLQYWVLFTMVPRNINTAVYQVRIYCCRYRIDEFFGGGKEQS